jgi:hypothetical protein
MLEHVTEYIHFHTIYSKSSIYPINWFRGFSRKSSNTILDIRVARGLTVLGPQENNLHFMEHSFCDVIRQKIATVRVVRRCEVN